MADDWEDQVKPLEEWEYRDLSDSEATKLDVVLTRMFDNNPKVIEAAQKWGTDVVENRSKKVYKKMVRIMKEEIADKSSGRASHNEPTPAAKPISATKMHFAPIQTEPVKPSTSAPTQVDTPKAQVQSGTSFDEFIQLSTGKAKKSMR